MKKVVRVFLYMLIFPAAFVWSLSGEGKKSIRDAYKEIASSSEGTRCLAVVFCFAIYAELIYTSIKRIMELCSK